MWIEGEFDIADAGIMLVDRRQRRLVSRHRSALINRRRIS
jgi:hypothetical protein